MFDLDREVAAWAAAVHAGRCRPEAGVAELSDHLHCEIDRARSGGLSDEQAFRAAIARLGPARELTAEYAKNRSPLGTACRVAARLDDPSIAEHRGLLLAHAVVWAALMIASALLLGRAASREVSAWLLIGVFIPLWLASDQILQAALRRSVRLGPGGPRPPGGPGHSAAI